MSSCFDYSSPSVLFPPSLSRPPSSLLRSIPAAAPGVSLSPANRPEGRPSQLTSRHATLLAFSLALVERRRTLHRLHTTDHTKSLWPSFPLPSLCSCRSSMRPSSLPHFFSHELFPISFFFRCTQHSLARCKMHAQFPTLCRRDVRIRMLDRAACNAAAEVQKHSRGDVWLCVSHRANGDRAAESESSCSSCVRASGLGLHTPVTNQPH